jgi:hypothetical protein
MVSALGTLKWETYRGNRKADNGVGRKMCAPREVFPFKSADYMKAETTLSIEW